MPTIKSAADTGAAFGQDDAEFDMFNTDRQLSALQTAATMMGTLREKKALPDETGVLDLPAYSLDLGISPKVLLGGAACGGDYVKPQATRACCTISRTIS